MPADTVGKNRNARPNESVGKLKFDAKQIAQEIGIVRGDGTNGRLKGDLNPCKIA